MTQTVLLEPVDSKNVELLDIEDGGVADSRYLKAVKSRYIDNGSTAVATTFGT